MPRFPERKERSEKKVPKIRFKEGDVEGYSEPLKIKDHWVLYYFENHAVNCEQCQSPYDKVYKRKGYLCKEGLEKANDVADLLFKVTRWDDNVYRKDHYTGKTIRIEVPKEYHNIRQLLKAVRRSNYAILDDAYDSKSYDRTYPVQARIAKPETHEVKPMHYPTAEEIFRDMEPDRRHKKKKSNQPKRDHPTNPAKNSYGSLIDDDNEEQDRMAYEERNYIYDTSNYLPQYLPIGDWSYHHSQDPHYERAYV